MIKAILKLLTHYKLLRMYDILTILLLSLYINRLSAEHIYISWDFSDVDSRKFGLYIFSLITIVIFAIINYDLNKFYKEAIENKDKDSLRSAYFQKIKTQKIYFIIMGIAFIISLLIFLYLQY